MKKHLLLLSCLFLIGEVAAQNWNFKNVPSLVRRKEGGSELFFQVRNSMPMNHSMWVRYRVTGKNSGANPNTDLNSFTFVDTIKFGNNDSIATLRFKAVLDNVTEGNDTFGLKLLSASMGTIISPDSTTIIVEDSTAPTITGRPLYSIATIRGSNTDGLPDSINRSCSIRGTLYGINRRPAGLGYQMFICDGTGCIGLFSGKTYSLLPTVQEGDSVEISGIIDEFQGLGQIRFSSSGDTIRKLGFNSNLLKPRVVTSLNESTEANLVKLNGLTLSGGTWQKDSAFELKMKNSGGTEFTIRIENKPSSNFGEPAAINTGTTYYITGLGSQFDKSTTKPFNQGYQLLPRKLSDISTVNSSIHSYSKSNQLTIFPTQVTNYIHVSLESEISETIQLDIIDMLGKMIRTQNVQLKNGENLFTISNLENLQCGNYYLRLQSSSYQMNKVFSVMK